MNPQTSALMILIVPFIGAAIIPLIGLVSYRSVPIFSLLVGLVSAVCAFFLPAGIPGSYQFGCDWLPGILKTGFLLDTLSLVPALIATWIGFLVLVFSMGYMKNEEDLPRYYSLTLLFIGSMVGMSLADNFVALFFFWEVMGVCSYLLIGFFYRDPKAANAGIKAFITTKIGDVGLLASILILYSLSGTFDITQNLNFTAKMTLFTTTLVSFGFIFGAVGKSAQVPLHVWLPDAMEAPTTISALIHAATMVNAGVYLLARVSPILAKVPSAMDTIQWIGVSTAFLGALLATFNNDLKRILAYSTVSQLGYMVFAVGIGGVFASQFHLFSHAIFKALLFLCAGSVIHEIGTRDIREMGGLRRMMPITSTAFLIGALALMGLPILNGFFSKDLILEEAIKHNAAGPLTLAVIAALFTAFYAIRTTATVFWGETRTAKHVTEAPSSMTLPLILLACGSLVSWLLVGRISEGWRLSGLIDHSLNWRELLKETFSSSAFLYTISAIILGFVLFIYRRVIGSFLRTKVPVLFKVMAVGLGFDIFYGWVCRFVYIIGKIIRYLWDEIVMEGINKLVGWLSIVLSNLLRKMQTGDIHWNLLYIIITLIILLGAILW